MPTPAPTVCTPPLLISTSGTLPIGSFEFLLRLWVARIPGLSLASEAGVCGGPLDRDRVVSKCG